MSFEQCVEALFQIQRFDMFVDLTTIDIGVVGAIHQFKTRQDERLVEVFVTTSTGKRELLCNDRSTNKQNIRRCLRIRLQLGAS